MPRPGPSICITRGASHPTTRDVPDLGRQMTLAEALLFYNIFYMHLLLQP